MAKKNNEELLQIEDREVNDNILLPNSIDIESIRHELKEYVDNKVTNTFIEELDKANKKLLREKSRRIFWKNVVIIILFLLCGFLTYLLYSNNYFDKFFNKNNNIPVEKEEKKEEPKEEKKEEIKVTPTPTLVPTPSPTPTPSFDDLKKEYGSLLDNYYVTDDSIYLVDFYDAKLSSDMKKYITLNSFDFSTFEKEEDYNIIKDSTFKLMYEKLFNDEYNSSTFSYDDNKIRYVKSMEAYMTSSLLVHAESNIKREIKDIKLDGGNVIITTIDGLIKDNKLYNIITNDEIKDYKEDSLLKYEDKLNKLVYTFKDNKLISLSK